MVPFKRALDLINKSVSEIRKFEEVKIKDCLSRIVAKNYKAKFNSPNYDTSAMDGIVILKDDLNKIKKFRIVGEIKAGNILNKEIKSGEAKLIFTGALIPGKKKKNCSPK